MIRNRMALAVGALAATAAWPAAAQEIRIYFVALAPVPIAGWIVAAIAGALGVVAHPALRARARTLGVMAAATVVAGALAWDGLAPGPAQAVPPTSAVNLTASPASVVLHDALWVYQLVNATNGKIRILSIERVNAPAFAFVAAPAPECSKQQEL